MQKLRFIYFSALIMLASVFTGSLYLCVSGSVSAAALPPGENPISIEFTYGGETWKFYDKFNYDKNDTDLIHELTRRGCFLSPGEKAEKINEIISLGFTKKQAADLVLNGLDDFTGNIKKKINKPAADSEVRFDPGSAELFKISEDKTGLAVDEKKLYGEIVKGLKNSSRFCVKVPVVVLYPKITKAENVKNTSLKASFGTSYENSSPNRKDNIKLAISKFNGLRIKPCGEVSFNRIVGARTEANGFKEAKIILNGKYEDGVGGGVCQSSTTLYNAAILAGLKIKEWHRHSLPCSYTAASFDAMVSSHADLVFVNDTENDIFIKTVADGSRVSVWIYGQPNEFKIVRESEIIKTVEAETKVIIDTAGEYADKVYYEDEKFYITRPIDGLVSKGYLKYYKNGMLAETKQIRTDIYGAQDGLVVKGANKRPEPEINLSAARHSFAGRKLQIFRNL